LGSGRRRNGRPADRDAGGDEDGARGADRDRGPRAAAAGEPWPAGRSGRATGHRGTGDARRRCRVTVPRIDPVLPPVQRVRRAYARIREVDRPEVWIHLRPESDVVADATAAQETRAAGADLPLAGQLLAVKDNVDVAGLPTTAGCPSYAYTPS